MEVYLTKHARDMLAVREISMEWVLRVLEHPAVVEPDGEDIELEHRMGRIKENGDRVLRVIIKKNTLPVRVITAFFDRSMRGKL